MAHVAQAYFHFTKSLPPKQLRRFGRAMDTAAKQAGAEHFDREIHVLVEIEDGSLIGRVSVYAAVLGVWTGLLSDYKGVRESFALLCEDARSFGLDVCNRAIDEADAQPGEIYRTERRTKVTGKISRLLSDLDRLQRSTNELSPKQMKGELARAARQLEAIARQLEPKEQRQLVEVLDHTKLPPPREWPTEVDGPPKAALKPEQLELTYQAPLMIQGPPSDKHKYQYKNAFVVKGKKKRPKKRKSKQKSQRQAKGQVSV